MIKISALINYFYIDKSDIIYIKGVTDNYVQSLGTISIEFIFDNITFSHRFHVVPDQCFKKGNQKYLDKDKIIISLLIKYLDTCTDIILSSPKRYYLILAFQKDSEITVPFFL